MNGSDLVGILLVLSVMGVAIFIATAPIRCPKNYAYFRERHGLLVSALLVCIKEDGEGSGNALPIDESTGEKTRWGLR